MVARTYTSLPPIVNKWFQCLFHSPPGVLFTFPSRYSFTIGHQVVFSLGGWSPQFPTGFLVPRGTQDTASPTESLRLQASHLLRLSFPEHSAIIQQYYLRGPTTPTLTQTTPFVRASSTTPIVRAGLPRPYVNEMFCVRVGLGSSPFARRY